jgi:hypothetical protein
MQEVQVQLNPELPWQKEHSTRRRVFRQQIGLKFDSKVVNCYIWGLALYGVVTWILLKVDQKYMESFESG